MDFDGDEDDDFFDPLAVEYDEDEDDEFFEASRMSLVSASIKRLVSIKSTLKSNPSIKSSFKYNPSIKSSFKSNPSAASTSKVLPKGNYDMWMAEPGDVNERRKRLLQGMGLTSKKEFLRLATSKRVRAISIKIEAPPEPACAPTPTPTMMEPEGSGSNAGPVDSSAEKISAEETRKDGGNGATVPPPPPQSYRAIVLVRSRSDGDVELFSSKIKQRKEELIGPVSKNKITRTLSGHLTSSAGVSQYACAVKLGPRGGGPNHIQNDAISVVTDDGFGSFFLIKNLDTGKDFIVKDIDEEGMWNSLNDVQTGKELTMEEFEKSVGYSPVVKELMRRASRANGGRKVKKGFRNSIKGGALLKSIKGGVVHSIKKVDKVEKEEEKEKEEERESSLLTGKCSSQWVDAHQCGKTYKEFTALHLCQEIRGHEGSIWAMSFSSDWKFLASGGEDSVIHVWEVRECEVVPPGAGGGAEESGSGGGEGEGAAEGEGGGGGDGDEKGENWVEISAMPAEMWRKGRKSGKGNPFPDYVQLPETVVALSETPVCSFQGHSDQVLDLCWSKSQVLLSSSMDKTVKMWDMETKTCLKTFPHKDYVTCIQFNPIDDKFFLSGSLDGKIRIWSIPDNRVVDWTDVHEMVTVASYTPDAQGAVVGTQEGTCAMYSTVDSQLEHQMDIQRKKKAPTKKFPSPAKKLPGFQSPTPLGKITGFQFAPWNPSEVLVTSADSRIGIYNGADIIQKFKGFKNTSSQISASFTPNGKHIISASEDSQVCIWKVEESKIPASGKKKPTALIIQAHEHFQCKDVSVAITWPGSSKTEPPVVDLNSKKKPTQRPTGPPLPPSATLKQKKGSNEETAAAAEPPPEVVEGGDSSGGGGAGLPPLPKKKNEENATSGDENESTQVETQGSNNNNVESVSDGETAQTTPSDNVSAGSNSGTIQATAWGVVIVTANQEGEIRVYQNFGLPLKLARPLF